MSQPQPTYCLVDDTPLTTNLDEIEPWVQGGSVALVIPLYTLERLHLLKKDASQIGQNARKAVRFLDHITSASLRHDPVLIQGPDDQYQTWSDVEAHYLDPVTQQDTSSEAGPPKHSETTGDDGKARDVSPAQMMNNLSLSSQEVKSSPVSTPPLSPSASEPQSAKTSPEGRCASVSKLDATPVPPTLKPLVNFAVWYAYASRDAKEKDLVFLTNSADAAQIAKDFGIITKTIHQLRAVLAERGTSPVGADQPKHKKKGSSRRTSFKSEPEPKTLFRYDDDGSSEDEELLFQPRPKDMPRPRSAGRGAGTGPSRGRGVTHSPSNSTSTPSAPKPQVPVEEIDPDSFDRGTFARGTIPLANVGNHYTPLPANPAFGRGGQRNFSSPAPRGGGYRGNTFRGRGRGRLFVP